MHAGPLGAGPCIDSVVVPNLDLTCANVDFFAQMDRSSRPVVSHLLDSRHNVDDLELGRNAELPAQHGGDLP